MGMGSMYKGVPPNFIQQQILMGSPGFRPSPGEVTDMGPGRGVNPPTPGQIRGGKGLPGLMRDIPGGLFNGGRPWMPRIENTTQEPNRYGNMVRGPQGNYGLSPQFVNNMLQQLTVPYQTVEDKKKEEEANKPKSGDPLSAFFRVFNRNNLPSNSYGAFGPRRPGIRG